jgi:uncharacterized protein (TIGR04255 family)
MEQKNQDQDQEGCAMARRKVDFEDPPVVETSLGVAFAPIRNWSLLHYGLLWGEQFRDLYPKADIKMPTAPVEITSFDVRATDRDPNLDALPLRCRYSDESDTQLVHIQNNRFVRNWRATAQNPGYKHYDNLRPLFRRDWELLLRFLKEHKLAPPEVWSCEVTYINHLVKGREWHTLDEIPKMFPSLTVSENFGQSHQMRLMSFNLSYEVDDGSATLQVTAQPALRESDGKEIIQLSLTALGTPKGSDTESILAWLDLGHLAVVENFRDLSSPQLHQTWRIK